MRETSLKIVRSNPGSVIDWTKSELLFLDKYPWSPRSPQQDPGEMMTDFQESTAQILLTEDCVLLRFSCEDRFALARHVQVNEPVWQDSCIEFFVSPADFPGYFNFEFNCIGNYLVQFGQSREDRSFLTDETLKAKRPNGSQIDLIQVNPSLPRSPIKEFTEVDWTLEISISLDIFSKVLKAHKEDFLKADWKCNFTRCYGEGERTYACWNLIETEKPDFHRPEHFGLLRLDRG